MARKHYRTERTQASKHNRAAQKAAIWAGLHRMTAHRSRVAWRKNRNSHPMYRSMFERRKRRYAEYH